MELVGKLISLVSFALFHRSMRNAEYLLLLRHDSLELGESYEIRGNLTLPDFKSRLVIYKAILKVWRRGFHRLCICHGQVQYYVRSVSINSVEPLVGYKKYKFNTSITSSIIYHKYSLRRP